LLWCYSGPLIHIQRIEAFFLGKVGQVLLPIVYICPIAFRLVKMIPLRWFSWPLQWKSVISLNNNNSTSSRFEGGFLPIVYNIVPLHIFSPTIYRRQLWFLRSEEESSMLEAYDVPFAQGLSFYKLRCSRRGNKANSIWSEKKKT